MSEESWTVERIHQDIYDARTKIFVVAKVLETGTAHVIGTPRMGLGNKARLKGSSRQHVQNRGLSPGEEFDKWILRPFSGSSRLPEALSVRLAMRQSVHVRCGRTALDCSQRLPFPCPGVF